MELVILGIVAAVNLWVIKLKFDRKRYEDAVVDLILFGVLAYMFSGSYAGMIVATVASLCISIFLFVSPPKFGTEIRKNLKKLNEEMNGTKKADTKGPFDL